jgi:PAS domain S-box-containing protein
MMNRTSEPFRVVRSPFMSDRPPDPWDADPRLSCDLLRSILDTMADGVYIVDNEGIIRSWNRGAERITGYTAEDVVGQPCDFLKGDRCAECRDERNRCPLLAGDTVVRMECRITGKDGRSIPLVKSGKPLCDEDGTQLGVVENISMQEVYRRIELASESGATVLVTGESGTGKELAAQSIHGGSPRAEGPFVMVNCSALPETLLESELFGHVKGAFTGALFDKAGRFETADGGTIFLDEIGDVSPLIQLKLLRVLQEKTFERVGESRSTTVDVRIITATNRNLKERVSQGAFREDLYYRINVFPVHMPPLRERREDIPLLCDHFVREGSERTGKRVDGFGEDALRLLMDYLWPGNVRELENAVEHAFVTAKGPTLGVIDLPAEIRNPSSE